MTAVADSGRGRTGQRRALRQLLPHLWPADDWDLRARVVLAVVFLVAFSAAGVVNNKCLGAGLYGGAVGLLIGLLFGWLMADSGCPTEE